MNWKNLVGKSGLPNLYSYDYKYLYQDYLIERFKGLSKPYSVYKQVDDVKIAIDKRGLK